MIAWIGLTAFGVSAWLFAFISNGIYVTHLPGEGFKVATTTVDVAHLAQWLRIELPLDPTRTTLSPA